MQNASDVQGLRCKRASGVNGFWCERCVVQKVSGVKGLVVQSGSGVMSLWCKTFLL